MIEITRVQARQLRAVLRQSIPPGTPRADRGSVEFVADQSGLRVRARLTDAAIERRYPNPCATDSLVVPVAILDDIEGRTSDVVRLERSGELVQARWTDRGMPQVREYALAPHNDLSPFPEEPAELVPIGHSIRTALEDAGRTTIRDATRFALTRVQLRGTSGEIVGTDGQQLLIQSGFRFPWNDDVLVSALRVFTSRELPSDVLVVIGRTEKHVCLRIGPWSFFLAIDSEGRFPRVENVVPSPNSITTTCHLRDGDATFLAAALPRLPGEDKTHGPVTVDLNGHVLVRARADDQKNVTEVELSRSEISGQPVRFVTDRGYLARALFLGFNELQLVDAKGPVVARDDRRTYVWLPLVPDTAVPADPSAERIQSAAAPPPTLPARERRKPVMKLTQPALQARRVTSPAVVPSDATATDKERCSLMAEAESLRSTLRDCYARCARLVTALKRQRKQSRLVQSTLASLRQLQQIEA